MKSMNSPTIQHSCGKKAMGLRSFFYTADDKPINMAQVRREVNEGLKHFIAQSPKRRQHLREYLD